MREFRPQVYARVGGLLYLIVIVVGFFGEYVRDQVRVSGNAALTAAHLRSSEQLWRLAIAGDLFMLTCAVGLVMILYVLLRPVNVNLARLVVLFNVVSLAIEAGIHLDLLAALFALGNADYLKAFSPAQLDALAYLSLRSHAHGFGISLIFFGCVCLFEGYLIFRSGYLPPTIGILMQIAGVCYLTNSFTLLVAPALADKMFPAILVPAFIGEASLCLWLLLKGVNLEQWHRRVSVV